MSKYSPRMESCENRACEITSRKLDKSYDFSFVKKKKPMELLLDNAFMSLPGAMDRCEFTSNYSLRLVIAFTCNAIPDLLVPFFQVPLPLQ